MSEARTQARWQMAAEGYAGDDPAATLARLQTQLQCPESVARLLLRRGIDDPQVAERFFNPRLSDLSDPCSIPGLAAAARRILQAVKEGQPVVIYGDYDVDGVSASAILWRLLQTMGASVFNYIPHRLDEGYGLSEQAIAQLPQLAGDVMPLVVTVDCGITAVQPAALAASMGMELIITDHHRFDADDLPPAHLVHPALTPGAEDHPLARAADATLRRSNAMLCGAGVAYKLAWQVAREACGSERLGQAHRELMVELLSLVALATVADVVPLIEENRLLTIFGLGRIPHSPFPGLTALVERAGLSKGEVGAYDIGFRLAPMLNACGRMGHADEAFELLICEDAQRAAQIASSLHEANQQRRTTERAIFQAARQQVVDHGYDAPDQRAIVLHDPAWHPGVIGIVASRLVDCFHRPVVMLASDGELASGSARSVDGVSIHDALSACQALLQRFGGHDMAAGMGLATRDIDALRAALVAHVNGKLTPEDLVPVLSIDLALPIQACQETFFDQIARFEPFGRGNPKPMLCIQNAVLAQPPRLMGQQGRHLLLMLRQGRSLLRAVGFGMGDRAEQLAEGMAIDLVAEPVISTWQGRRRAELHLADLRPAGLPLASAVGAGV